MSIAALFERLTDFAPHASRADDDKPFPAPTYPQAVPEPDLPTLIAIAVTEAEEALTARLVAEHEAALEAERQQHAAELSAFGIHMGTETGTAMAAGLRDMEARVVHLATDAAARIIAGLVSDDIRKRSIDALAAAVLSAMEDREAVRIRVSGPQFMFDALATALGERAGNVDFTEATGFDLSVSIDDNLFETRLGEWSSALSETLP
ncbi:MULTISPECIES: hypothetical protein [Hyphomicrobiales]|jgi:hypothetical protein|uniref:hypothetical protein n=1 Tax=Hyphomicrobiales TaxID=356 RepID=UPI00039B5C20|nr:MULTISPECIES: hypothetical protein [Phyllobacteriaceae]MCX8569831.1 hypothetical protein [Aminobacter sp. MET-1]